MTGNKPEKGACGTKSRRTQNTLQKGCFSERLGGERSSAVGDEEGRERAGERGKRQGNSAVKRGTLQMRLRHFSLSVVDRQSIQTGILRI